MDYKFLVFTFVEDEQWLMEISENYISRFNSFRLDCAPIFRLETLEYDRVKLNL